MRNRFKNKRKTYYIGLNKAINDVIMTTTKSELSKFLDISVDSIRRHLKLSSIYDTSSFTIWSNKTIKRIRRGFAIKPGIEYKRHY
jgi:hypothetical protein